MPLLLFLFYPLAEIYAYYEFISRYSFWDALVWCFVSGLLGLTLMFLQGRGALLEMQKSLVQGQLPSRRVIHRAVMMFGGLLILLPGLISDVLGVFLILPGTRHLFVFLVVGKMTSAILGKGSVFFQFGGFRTGGGPGGPQPPPRSQPQEREAEVIDIESIRIESSKKNKE